MSIYPTLTLTGMATATGESGYGSGQPRSSTPYRQDSPPTDGVYSPWDRTEMGELVRARGRGMYDYPPADGSQCRERRPGSGQQERPQPVEQRLDWGMEDDDSDCPTPGGSGSASSNKQPPPSGASAPGGGGGPPPPPGGGGGPPNGPPRGPPRPMRQRGIPRGFLEQQARFGAPRLSDLPKFGGKPGANFQRFLSIFENRMALYNVPFDRFLDYLSAALEGEAYDLLAKALYRRPMTYQEGVRLLQDRYKPGFLERQQLLATRQRAQETVDEFGTRIRESPAFDTVDDDVKLGVFLRGLRPYIRDRVIMQEPTTLHKAMALARLVESMEGGDQRAVRGVASGDVGDSLDDIPDGTVPQTRGGQASGQSFTRSSNDKRQPRGQKSDRGQANSQAATPRGNSSNRNNRPRGGGSVDRRQRIEPAGIAASRVIWLEIVSMMKPGVWCSTHPLEDSQRALYASHGLHRLGCQHLLVACNSPHDHDAGCQKTGIRSPGHMLGRP